MLNMLKTNWKGIIIMLTIVLMSLSIVSLAQYLISKSEDSQVILKETYQDPQVVNKGKHTEKPNKEGTKKDDSDTPTKKEPEVKKPSSSDEPFDPLYGEDWEEYAKISVNPDYFNGKMILGEPLKDDPKMNYPKQVYNPEFIHCRMSEYLGDCASPADYENICKILDNSKEYFAKVEPVNYEYNIANSPEPVFVDDIDCYEPEKIQGAGYVELQAEMIGFADKNTVLLTNDLRTRHLFLVDFSGYATSKELNEDFFTFGDHPKIAFDGTKIGIERIGGYVVTVIRL